MDNDDAGQKGSEIIQEICKDIGIETKNIRFGNKNIDPGELTETQR